jgi:uncharacterized protein (DUF1810 family)
VEFDHFMLAQEPVYAQVLRELSDGQKKSHWIWFVFPQLRGLGFSAMSDKYALDSVEQAGRYLEHEVLGARLHECTQLVLAVRNRPIQDIFGADDVKFRSSMTLFSLCQPPVDLFDQALVRYFAGQRDGRTLELLGPKK